LVNDVEYVPDSVIRTFSTPITEPIARTLAKKGMSPDFLSILGLAFAVIAGVLFATKPSQPYLAAVAIMASGFMDMLDGAVARETRRFSRTLDDSTMDRLAAVAIYAGLLSANYVPAVVVLLAIGASFLASYVRIKAKSLGISMTDHLGIAQRAEKLIVLIVFSFANYVSIGIYACLALSVISIVQRYSYAVKAIGDGSGEVR
jgi:archaetidylinositol phosphate synthase